VARHASDLSAAVFRLAQHALSLPLAPKAPINAEAPQVEHDLNMDDLT